MKNNLIMDMKLLLLIIMITSPNLFAQKIPSKQTISTQNKRSSSNDSLQYALGAYLGQWVNTNGFSVNHSDLFIKGMNDALSNKTLMIPAAMIATKLDAYQKQQTNERSSKQEKLLFESLKEETGVGMLPNGVAYVIMKVGNGPRPKSADSVLLHLKGYLPDGKLFEDTYAKKRALRSTPASLIKGMNEALQIMPAGSTWRVFIPSNLGYAEKGIPGLIPPYAALIFEIELISAYP